MNAFQVATPQSSCFSEWLTHNSGALFGLYEGVGRADIVEYQWDEQKSLAHLVGKSAQMKCDLRVYYNNTVAAIAAAHFAGQPNGSTAAFPLDGSWYDVPHDNTAAGVQPQPSPDWVPKTTVLFDNPAVANPVDDLFGSIGRGRLLLHKARYFVRKDAAGLVVTHIDSTGQVTDLYDFTMEAPLFTFAQDAAVLQVGYGNGSYGPQRGTANIYRTRVSFLEGYDALPNCP
jgi:hypothetical protein